MQLRKTILALALALPLGALAENQDQLIVEVHPDSPARSRTRPRW